VRSLAALDTVGSEAESIDTAALLGEAELLAGQIICRRSPPDSIDHLTEDRVIPEDKWLLPITAYVPQSAFLQNADIKHNVSKDTDQLLSAS